MLASIVTPTSVKSLDDILNEFVQLKEADLRKQQISNSNLFVADLFALLDHHSSKPLSHDLQPPSSAAVNVQQQLPHETYGNKISRYDDFPGPHPVTQPAAATPRDQTVPAHSMHVAAAASRCLPSSQHRKGAPKRRTEPANAAPSSAAKVACPHTGDLLCNTDMPPAAYIATHVVLL